MQTLRGCFEDARFTPLGYRRLSGTASWSPREYVDMTTCRMRHNLQLSESEVTLPGRNTFVKIQKRKLFHYRGALTLGEKERLQHVCPGLLVGGNHLQ